MVEVSLTVLRVVSDYAGAMFTPAPAITSTAADWLRRLAQLEVASPFAFELNARSCLRLNLTADNAALGRIDAADTAAFSTLVDAQISAAGADYAAGGYSENRALYQRSPVFGSQQADARTLHLGIDLWLAAGTPVFVVLGGVIHSIQDNAQFGDYGPTVILRHELEGRVFHTLYGHLSRRTLSALDVGQTLATGTALGWLGEPHENMGWPPHLHFQIVIDLHGHWGDYPGVCRLAEAERWLHNCPDPNLLLRIDALT